MSVCPSASTKWDSIPYKPYCVPWGRGRGLDPCLPDAWAVVAREDGEEVEAVLPPQPQRRAAVEQRPRAVPGHAVRLPKQVPHVVPGLHRVLLLGLCLTLVLLRVLLRGRYPLGPLSDPLLFLGFAFAQDAAHRPMRAFGLVSSSIDSFFTLEFHGVFFIFKTYTTYTRVYLLCFETSIERFVSF